jgi:uncharacterized protein YukE
MSDFVVRHGEYSDANMGLKMNCSNMDAIMQDLNATLSQIGSATSGKATPLWESSQQTWNQKYQQMMDLLNQHTTSSISVGDIFENGDNAGARAMM